MNMRNMCVYINISYILLPDGIIEDIREFFQIEDSHFKHFYTKPFK